jgi:hypothetical protein
MGLRVCIIFLKTIALYVAHLIQQPLLEEEMAAIVQAESRQGQLMVCGTVTVVADFSPNLPR